MATPTLYISTIEGEYTTGIIVSNVPTDDLDNGGQSIDEECIIIWHYMGRVVNNENTAGIEVFKNWVRNIYVKAGIIVVME